MAKGDSEKYKELMIIHGHLKSLTKVDEIQELIDGLKNLNVDKLNKEDFRKLEQILDEMLKFISVKKSTKAENGVVRLDDIKLWETINTTCSLRGITLSRGNISIIRDAILYTFGTPSITKDQLLATIDKAEKEYFSEGAYYRTDIPQGICNHIKQRIEELYNEKIN